MWNPELDPGTEKEDSWKIWQNPGLEFGVWLM